MNKIWMIISSVFFVGIIWTTGAISIGANARDLTWLGFAGFAFSIIAIGLVCWKENQWKGEL